MKYLIRTALALALLALASPVIAKGPLDVYVRYAGYGHDTSVEMVDGGQGQGHLWQFNGDHHRRVRRG